MDSGKFKVIYTIPLELHFTSSKYSTVQHFWEGSWESLDCKEIKPVNPKGNQPWIFIGRTDAEAETPILRPPEGKSQLTGKDSDPGKDWRQENYEATEDEMVGWHHWLNGHEFEQTPGDSKGQGSLVCCSPWSCKELDMTSLNKNNKYVKLLVVQ